MSDQPKTTPNFDFDAEYRHGYEIGKRLLIGLSREEIINAWRHDKREIVRLKAIISKLRKSQEQPDA